MKRHVFNHSADDRIETRMKYWKPRRVDADDMLLLKLPDVANGCPQIFSLKGKYVYDPTVIVKKVRDIADTVYDSQQTCVSLSFPYFFCKTNSRF